MECCSRGAGAGTDAGAEAARDDLQGLLRIAFLPTRKRLAGAAMVPHGEVAKPQRKPGRAALILSTVRICMSWDLV